MLTGQYSRFWRLTNNLRELVSLLIRYLVDVQKPNVLDLYSQNNTTLKLCLRAGY